MPKTGLAPLFAFALLLAGAPGSQAGVVSVVNEPLAPMADQPGRYCEQWRDSDCYGEPQDRTVIRYVAGPGEVNDVSTSAYPWTIRDRGAPIEIADPRCEHVDGDPHTVYCGPLPEDSTDVASIHVDLGDEDDRLDGTHERTDVEGGEGDDVLTGITRGRTGRGVIDGGPGDDVIRAARGEGGPGNDRLEGEGAYEGAGFGLLGGGPGDDTIQGGPWGNHHLCGGTLQIVKGYYRMEINAGREGYNVEWKCVSGEDGDDTIVAGPGHPEGWGDLIEGGGGADLLRGGNRRDDLRGGAGDDRIFPTGAANQYWFDFARGDAGNDFIDSRNQRVDQVDNCGEGQDEWLRDGWDLTWFVSSRECEKVEPALPYDEFRPEAPRETPEVPAGPWPVIATPEPPAVAAPATPKITGARLDDSRRLALELECRAQSQCRGKVTVAPTAPRNYAVKASRKRTVRIKVSRALARSIRAKRRAKVSLASAHATRSKTVRVRLAKPR